ncbi:hypothetical protein V6S02_16810 [Microbacterium sp. CCNWLW134]|uniref:hypothetical protein n=1 Tax=Microbacterium sp. CCNWLW134 TaxID=3122064 RepID=UPI00301008E8
MTDEMDAAKAQRIASRLLTEPELTELLGRRVRDAGEVSTPSRTETAWGLAVAEGKVLNCALDRPTRTKDATL